MNTRRAVQAYWEDPSTVSILDKNLHQLEIETVAHHLLPTDVLADIGCGDGSATLHYARTVRTCVGIERSEWLRQKASAAVSAAGVQNVTIRSGDILDMPGAAEVYDAIVTQRLLINLASWEEQQHALLTIHRMLKVGGRYIMVENTDDGFEALNTMRATVGLEPIPQHWHNRFFDYDALMAFMRGKFRCLTQYDFGLYYLLTRVYVPMFASFIGVGAAAVKDPMFDKADAAARLFFKAFRDRVRISGGRALGPIQVFVFEREGGA